MSVLPFVCLTVSRPLHSSAVKAAATFAIPVDPRLLAHPGEATLPSGLSAFYSQTLSFGRQPGCSSLGEGRSELGEKKIPTARSCFLGC